MREITNVNLKQIVTKRIKRSLNFFGLDIIRLKNNPKYTLLGIRSLPIRTIIDIGANTGQFSKYIIEIFPEAQLFCFEPLPVQYKKLKAWGESKNRNKPMIHKLAIGDTEGEKEIIFHADHSPLSSILVSTELLNKIYPYTQKEQRVLVKISKLDNAMRSLVDIAQRDILIKIDVQGYEDRVIRGGKETFNKAKAVLIEVNLDLLYHNQASFKDLLLMLYDLGYNYAGNLDQDFGADGHVTYFDAIFIK